MPAWASRRCYFPPSKRLPLGVSSPAARPDLILEVGLEPPAAAPASRAPHEGQQIAVEPASRIPREELPPTIIIVKERVKRINVETEWKREENNYSERKEKNK